MATSSADTAGPGAAISRFTNQDGIPNYYAEYLPNVRSLSLTITVPPEVSSSDASPLKLTVQNDRSSLVMSYGDVHHQCPLPARVLGSGAFDLPVNLRPESDRVPRTHLFFRLPAGPLCAVSEGQDDVAMWTASQLMQSTDGIEVQCKTCAAVIVPRGAVKEWKDLPSESWAEMMDLWHCHKPAEHGQPGHEHPGMKKGYAAGSKLVAQKGTGLVDVLSFLLVEDDCQGITIQSPSSTTTTPTPPPVLCTACSSTLGFHDLQTSGLRLQKPYLSLSLSPTASTPTSSPPTQTFPMQKWLSAALLATVSDTGIRKFIATSLPLETWIFSTSLTFTSAAFPTPTEGIKVLFKNTAGGADAERDVDALRSRNLHVDLLALPRRLEDELLRCLEESNAALPGAGRVFAHVWRVGLLAKFCVDECVSV